MASIEGFLGFVFTEGFVGFVGSVFTEVFVGFVGFVVAGGCTSLASAEGSLLGPVGALSTLAVADGAPLRTLRTAAKTICKAHGKG